MAAIESGLGLNALNLRLLDLEVVVLSNSISGIVPNSRLQGLDAQPRDPSGLVVFSETLPFSPHEAPGLTGPRGTDVQTRIGPPQKPAVYREELQQEVRTIFG